MTGANGPIVVSIDFGTSNTVAALAVPGRSPRLLSLDGASWLPSAVFLADDGTLAVGRDAERRARLAPERFEANPKRRIDDGEIMLGSAVVPVVDAIAAVLRRVAEEVKRQLAGRLPDLVVLSHPARWGSTRLGVLSAAARRAGLGDRLMMVPEPVAAAVHFASLQDSGDGSAPGLAGRPLAVYDLGGGTFDCAVVVTENNRYAVAAADGLVDVGGVDFDQAVLDHLGRVSSSAAPERWRELLRPHSSADRRLARAMHEDVRSAKETLSRYSQAEVPLPPPLSDALISRVEFEGLIRPMVRRTVEVLAATISRAGLTAQQLAGIYLVGGSSRIPLVGGEIADRIGVLPTTLDQPEATVALGAALWPAAHQLQGGSRAVTPATPTGPASQPTSAVTPFPSQESRIAQQQHRPVGPAAVAGRPPGANGPNGPNHSTGTPAVGWRKSRRGAVIAVAAAVVTIIAAAVIVVVTTRGSSDAGPSGTGQPGTSSTASSTTSRTSSASSPSSPSPSPSSSGPVDPSKCPVDTKNDQGLTSCMTAFAGGLVAGSECTIDAKKLGISEDEKLLFGSLAPVWTACFTPDRSKLALLFQNTNGTGRDATWQAVMSTLITPHSCGSFLTTGPRGVYVLGTSKTDGEPMVVWEDTGLPLLGMFRPPKAGSVVSEAELFTYFKDHTGFGLTDQDCTKVFADTKVTVDKSTDKSTGGSAKTSGGTSSSVSVNESTVRPDDPTKCLDTPLDANNMSPCLLMLAGNAPKVKQMCFTGDNLSSFKDLGQQVAPTVVAACAFQPQLMSTVVVYLQFADMDKSGQVFQALAQSGVRSKWQRGGRTGSAVSQLTDGDSKASITWAFDDMPVVIYAYGEGKTGGPELTGESLTKALDVFWQSSLLPTG